MEICEIEINECKQCAINSTQIDKLQNDNEDMKWRFPIL